MSRTGGRRLTWALAVATGLSLVALAFALPPPDVCLLLFENPPGTSQIEVSRLPPLGVRCTYTGPGRSVVMDHRTPLPLVLAPPLLAAATVLAAVRQRRRRRNQPGSTVT